LNLRFIAEFLNLQVIGTLPINSNGNLINDFSELYQNLFVISALLLSSIL
jgi:hypothetical protein